MLVDTIRCVLLERRFFLQFLPEHFDCEVLLLIFVVQSVDLCASVHEW
jgi:hypothetical protein